MPRNWPQGITDILTGFRERWGVFRSNDGIEGILWANLNVVSVLLILSKSVTLLANEWSLDDCNTTPIAVPIRIGKDMAKAYLQL